MERIKVFVAACYLALQLELLGNLLKMARATAPSFVAWRFAFDETSQRLTMSGIEGCTDEQVNSSWQVCVARLHLYVAWGIGVTAKIGQLVIVLPPMLVASATARNVHNAFNLSPVCVAALQAAKMIAALA